MRKTGPRWFGFAVPLACLIALILGRFESPGYLLLFYLMLTFGSLGAPDAFSRAAAKQMSTKKVTGSLIMAIVLSLITPIILCSYYCAVGDFTRPIDILFTFAAALPVILRCFEEFFASQGDSTSAGITTALTTIAMTAVMLLTEDRYSDEAELAHLITNGAVLLISGGIALGFSRREKPALNFAILKEIPAALARLLLFPAMCGGILFLNQSGARWGGYPSLLCGMTAGMILLEMTRSTFRRSKDESAGLKIGVALSVLSVTAGLAAIGMFRYMTGLMLAQAVILAAGAAAMLMYAPWDAESIAAEAIMIAAAALTVLGVTPKAWSFPIEILIAPATGILLCGIMFRQWSNLARGARANRLRRKALKRTR